MIKPIKRSHQKNENALHYPGIKNIKQKNRMQSNKVRQGRARGNDRIRSLLNFNGFYSEKPGNRFKNTRPLFDYRRVDIFRSFKSRLAEAKENAITHMIRIFEADPDPGLLLVNSVAEKEFSKTQTPDIGKTLSPDKIMEVDRLSGIYSRLLKLINKIYISLALDYELNVDPQPVIKAEQSNVSPKTKRFIPARINAVLITFKRTVKTVKTKSVVQLSEVKKELIKSCKSMSPARIKSFRHLSGSNYLHRNQLE